MDDIKSDQLNVGFLRDFISLPESYFSPGAEITFQNFYLRWGTHYIKSAKFGGQLKIMKTKEATKDLSMSEFATRAEADWKMTMSTFSAQASQSKSSSWWHEHESSEGDKASSGYAKTGSKSEADRNQKTEALSQEYSNERILVQGGDQQIAAAITEMYTTALTTELKDWLESIKDNPKPFSFVLRLVSDLLNIPFDTLFPAGEVDYGCLGKKSLKIEESTGRKYYKLKTTKASVGNRTASNGSETETISEIRFCDFADRKALEDSMTKKRLALERAVTVYLEEGRILSSDFLLPAGEAGCETATLAYIQGSKSGVPTWKEMIGGQEFTVIFDMPYDIPGIVQAQEVLQLKFIDHVWFTTRKGSVPHLYDGYENGGSNDAKGTKVSVHGLVMTYIEERGVFIVTDDDFKASAAIYPHLPEWIKGRKIGRAEYKKLLNHLSQKTDTIGNVPCSMHWSNAHRLDPTDGGKCIHFTAASEGDIFVVFASIPQNHETWVYIQISPDGVALYKAMRLQTTQLNDNAGGLGSATLYQSYFVCVTEDVKKTTTVIQYGKTPDNAERPHVWLSFTFPELVSLRYYSFGSGGSPVRVMGLSLLNKQPKDYIICREGTGLINGVCQQKCHSECKGCRTSGSNSPTDCIACKHLKVSWTGHFGSFEYLSQCPEHMTAVTATKTCTCKKKMEGAPLTSVADCLTECPLSHFEDDTVCKKCSSFCKDVSGEGKRVCSGPTAKDCNTCEYQHDGHCVKECRPGQKAVKSGEKEELTCHQCQPGHECKLGDENEDICVAGTASNDNRTKCEPCAAGEFSDTHGADACKKCPAGQYSEGGGSTSCVPCPAGKYNSVAGSTGCALCSVGKYSNTEGSNHCKPCPVGEYGNTKGSTNCTNCPAGKYSSTVGSTSCMDCPAGQYSSTAGSSSCLNCSAGQFSSTAASTSCTPCPAGKYIAVVGSTSCKPCPTGKYSKTSGSTNCLPCPAGEYNNASASRGCKPCPAGQYSSEAASTDCRSCPAGKYSTAGSTNCSACPAGKYSRRAASPTCKPCPPGKYISTMESTSCMSCPAGKHSRTAGSTSCSACPMGKYSNKAGFKICKDCPGGQYSNKVGSTSCMSCPAGYHSYSGAKDCRACSAGQYSKAGFWSCRTCPKGLTSGAKSSKCTCQPGYSRFKQSCFKSSKTVEKYKWAKEDCEAEGGLLAMPKDSATNTFLARLGNGVVKRGKFYIGLSVHYSRRWRYADMTYLAGYRFKNWGPGEPNNYGRLNEDCVVLFWNGRWNDVPCSYEYRFHCEIKLPTGH
ncbi:uncharacterized protein LOC144885162 [Branchiostoma floridae x Branchiostoma japonicum]